MLEDVTRFVANTVVFPQLCEKELLFICGIVLVNVEARLIGGHGHSFDAMRHHFLAHKKLSAFDSNLLVHVFVLLVFDLKGNACDRACDFSFFCPWNADDIVMPVDFRLVEKIVIACFVVLWTLIRPAR